MVKPDTLDSDHTNCLILIALYPNIKLIIDIATLVRSGLKKAGKE